MNKNYLVGSKVRLCLKSGKFLDGEIVLINKFANFPIKVFFQKINQVKYFNLQGENKFESDKPIEVIGHTSEKIAIEFANYCISEGFGTDARPQDFQKFLETYKPKC